MQQTPSNKQLFLVVVLALLNFSVAIGAESKHEVLRAQHNSSTIGIVGGSSLGTYTKITEDLAGEFDDIFKRGAVKSPLRIVPMLGKGSILNLYDLLYLKNVTFAFVQQDVATQLAKTDERLSRFEAARAAGDLKNLRYIELFAEEIRVVVNNGSTARARRDGRLITKPADLRGAIVGTGDRESGTWFTATTLLKLWADSDFIPNYSRIDDAVIELKNGNIDALIVVAAEPNSILENLSDNNDIDLLELTADRRAKNLGIKTTETTVKWQDKEYKTWSVNALLVGYTKWPKNHPRCIGLVSFVEYFDTFITNQPFQYESEKYHPKWTEVPIKQTSENIGNIKPLDFSDPCT